MTKLTFQFAFLSSIIILFVVSFFTYRSLIEFGADAKMVIHTEEVKDQLALYKNAAIRFSRNLRNAAFHPNTIDSIRISQFEKTTANYLTTLDSLVADNPTQLQAVAELKIITKRYSEVASNLALTAANTPISSLKIINQMKDEDMALQELLVQLSEMRNTENELLVKRSEEAANSQHFAPITLVSLVVIATCIISFLFFNTFHLFKQNEAKANSLAVRVKQVNHEMTKNVELRQLLQTIFDSSQNGIIAFSALRDEENVIIDFIFELANEQSAALLDHFEKELKGKTMLEVIPGNKDIGLFDRYVHVVETGETYRNISYYPHDGLDHWFDICAVKNGDGFVVTFSDVSNLKRYEESLLAKQKELEATNAELEQFAYIASHDLQEPLRKVRAFGDRLTASYREELGEKGQDYISRMQNAAARMQILIDDLLKFSRISRSKVEHKLFSLNQALATALDNLEIQIENKQAKITAKDLPQIMGDQVQIVQLFQNLISNALKYAKHNVLPHIEITAEKVEDQSLDKDLEYWKISVADNGIGFNNKYRSQIFNIFERLHGRREYSGTGIGLAICEKIMTNHHGRITADGTPDVGATFTFYLPKIAI
ncbi:MAG: ATP-binding protein [Bacteroidota bacterium]